MASSSQTAIAWGARLAPGSFAWLLPMEPRRPPSVREVLAFYRQQVGQGDGPRLRVDGGRRNSVGLLRSMQNAVAVPY